MEAVQNKCSICLDRIKDHKLIPCNHSFCYNCLEDHVRANLSNGKFNCPMCESSVMLPSKGVKAFKTNYYIQTAESVKQRAICIEHADQDIRLVCQKCKVFMCFHCKVRTHDRHPSKELSEVAREVEVILKTKENLCQERLNDLRIIEQDISRAEKSLNETEEAEIGAIDNQYSDILKALDKEVKDKKEKLKSAYEKIKKENANVKEKFLGESMLYSSAVELITQGSDLELSEKGPELVSKISKARSPPKKVPLNIPEKKFYRPATINDKAIGDLIGTTEDHITIDEEMKSVLSRYDFSLRG